MLSVIDHLMAHTGEVKRDVDAKFFGVTHPSRGYYIVSSTAGIWYLHHDGAVKEGVQNSSGKPAFWPTEKEALDFFDNWRGRTKRDHF